MIGISAIKEMGPVNKTFWETFWRTAYFSLFKVGLQVVKNCLTNKYQRNKQTNKK